MCGIVGVIGSPQAAGIVLEGLKRLEYRGYDSAGIAVLDGAGEIHLRKAVGKLEALEDMLKKKALPASFVGIGHTRWATHGVASETNAHPHIGQSGHGGPQIAVVHNGIIENYMEIRHSLEHHGASFKSDTDTEVIPVMIAEILAHGAPNLPAAVWRATQDLEGSFAFVAMLEGDGTQLVGTRRGAPLCVGITESTNYLVSDPLAVAGLTNHFIFLEDGDVITITADKLAIVDKDGKPVEREVKQLDLSADAQGKGAYKHYMLKEIYDQPAALAHLIESYTDAKTYLPTLPLSVSGEEIPHINIVACGTAYYAALTGKYIIEQLARVVVNVDVASEFRYRQPPLSAGGVFVAISQSGETADTLAALEYAKKNFQHTIAIVNVPTSSIARAADDVIDLKSGREIAVASTKAFTAMVAALMLLALQLSRAPKNEIAAHVQDLRKLPALVSDQLAHTKGAEAIAEWLATANSAFYLGRGVLAPLALEGALKLKEISYIHAEAYASGEMKHGPIALVEKGFPVINLGASNDGVFEKTVSNLKEIEARHGRIVLITDAAGAEMMDEKTRKNIAILRVPTVPALLLPIVFAIPLQLLAYYTAVAKGTDVDQPRNLAKSVTVE